MTRIHNFKILLPLISSLLFFTVTGVGASESDTSSNDLETFFAISLIGGVSETNLVGLDFQRVDKTADFLELNIEVQLRWKGFFYENPGRSQENIDGLFSGDAIGYNFYNSKHWALDVYVVNAFSDDEYTVAANSQVLLLPRDKNNRLGIRATGFYADYLAQFIVTPISFQSEIGGFNTSFSLRRTWLVKNWNLYATLGLNYQSEEIVDYYFGLSDTESLQIEQVLDNMNTPFKPYAAEGGLFTAAEIGFEYPVSEHFIFGGFISATQRPNSVTDSPLIFNGRVASTAGLSLTYVF